MKIGAETVGETPSNDWRDESTADSMARWRRVGELLKVWGTAVEVWLKILVIVLVGVATLLRGFPH